MNRRIYLLLGLCGLICPILLALVQKSPGYMDAEYYYTGGRRLSQGYGFTEEILWNFLDDPSGLPHPSHGYWMPLPSILAVPGLLLFHEQGFDAARLVFILLAALIPPLTAAIAFSLHQRKDLALYSGLLALIPVFYLPYLATTNSFIPCMVIGGLFFLLIPSNFDINRNKKSIPVVFFLIGLLSGLMHLTRPDGFVWLLTGLFSAVVFARGSELAERRSIFRYSILGCVFGYLLVMAPWFARNAKVFGSLLAPGGNRSLWVLEYNEMFIYPAGILTMERWLNSGWRAILEARVWAAGQNLQTIIAVQGEILLLPLILAGAFRLRHDFRIRSLGLTWLMVLGIMTLVFPYQGARGGFLHSGAGFQPVFWALAPPGLESFLEWGEQHRNWKIRQARIVFGSGMLALVAGLTFFITLNKVYSFSESRVIWNDDLLNYSKLEERLKTLGAQPNDIVMVNNAPGYQASTERAAISIPFADLENVCEAARRYRVKFMIMEIDQIPGETDLFTHPGDRACWDYLETSQDARIFVYHQ